jgi:hypothetical protein
MAEIKVSDKITLKSTQVSKAPVAKSVDVATNHIAVIDCSGSMSWELPKIRDQLKKKLPKLLGPKDTISIIWFSGRGQCGVLLEAEPVATLTDLTLVNQAIDRWLNPIGMTGFKEPLQEVYNLITKIKGKLPGTVFSLFFMSDGCDNQWPRQDILKTVEATAGSLASATFVEYGYYADRPLLTQMAEKSGGQLIFAANFDSYQPAFEACLGKKLSGAPKIEVRIPERPLNDFVFTLKDGELTTYGVEAFKANLPEDTREFWYLAEDSHPYNNKLSNKSSDEDLAVAYAAVSLYSVRMNSDVVLALLRGLGDVYLIERFACCFGKQLYSSFMEYAQQATVKKELRYTKGYDPTRVPADDAYTILDLLRLLSSDDKNHVLLDHPDFKYNQIGRSRIDADEVLTAEEQAKVDEINAKMAKTKKASDFKKLQDELNAILSSKKEALKFVAEKAPDGYSISNLVYNENRPNVSINLKLPGTVDLSSRLPEGPEYAKIPKVFPTFVYRNRTVIKDGLVNIESLPVRVTQETAKKLAELLPPEAKPTNISMVGNFVTGVIDLRALPVINRKMVASVSAKELFELQYKLLCTKAAQKVYKEYLDSRFPKKASAKDEEKYGEGAKWLLEQGFNYNGYAPPHTTQAEATDEYMGKQLDVVISGFKSSLPKVSDVRDRFASNKKQTTLGALMAPYVEEVEKYLQSEQYVDAKDKDATFKTWIDAKAKESIQKARQLMYQMACIKFGVIVGQVWFKEFSSLDENTLTVKLDGQDIACEVKMTEIAIKI